MNKNVEVLGDFMRYCRLHPDERFWQALRNWSGHNFIIARTTESGQARPADRDTFYWEGKDK